jgi:hypothetical protein
VVQAVEHQRQHHFGEQLGLQVRLGCGGFGQPRLDLGGPGHGDGVALAVRAAAGLGLAGLGIPDLTAVAGFLG